MGILAISGLGLVLILHLIPFYWLVCISIHFAAVKPGIGFCLCYQMRSNKDVFY